MDRSVIDFGSFLTQTKFEKNASFFYDINGNATGSDVIFRTNERDFIQPRAGLQVPFEIWGYSQTGKADSKYDNVYIWSHELAEALGEGRATRADAEQHLRNLFDNEAVQNVLRSVPGSCRNVF